MKPITAEQTEEMIEGSPSCGKEPEPEKEVLDKFQDLMVKARTMKQRKTQVQQMIGSAAKCFEQEVESKRKDDQNHQTQFLEEKWFAR